MVTDSRSKLFWSHVRKSKYASGCWPWTGHRDRLGYGRFGVMVGGRRRNTTAHRYSWCLSAGLVEVPAGKWVLHRCDNPRCVNPDHLYCGDAADNARDRVVRGRSGVRPGSFDEVTVVMMRELRQEGADLAELSVEFGVSKNCVAMMVRGDTYRRFGGPIRPRVERGRYANGSKRLGDETVRAIRAARESGALYERICAVFGVSRTTAGNICRGTAYTNVV